MGEEISLANSGICFHEFQCYKSDQVLFLQREGLQGLLSLMPIIWYNDDDRNDDEEDPSWELRTKDSTGLRAGKDD